MAGQSEDTLELVKTKSLSRVFPDRRALLRLCHHQPGLWARDGEVARPPRCLSTPSPSQIVVWRERRHFTPSSFSSPIMSSAMQQRKAEILAKRAKLAELKRQRELRQKEFSQVRANTGDASEVGTPSLNIARLARKAAALKPPCSFRSSHQSPVAQIAERSSMI